MSSQTKTRMLAIFTLRKLSILASTLFLTSGILNADIVIKQGWQNLGASQDLNTSIFDNTCVDYIWKYDADNRDWQVHIANGAISNYPAIPSFSKGEGYWLLGNADCNITVPSSGSLANAGDDQNVTVGESATLDASASTGSGALTYAWSIIYKPVDSNATLSDTTSSNPAFTADLSGLYVFGLVVSDGAVKSAVDTVAVTTNRYSRNDSTGIVSDYLNNLQWQDDVTSGTMNWYAAIEYCRSLNLYGGDWRVPEISDLQGIVDQTQSPAINPVFQHTVFDFYWSSTHSGYTIGIYYTHAYAIKFVWFPGNFNWSTSKTNSNYVRCVRARQ